MAVPRPIHLIAQKTLGEHRPGKFPGVVSLFLPELAVKAYWTDIHRTWARLADRVQVHLLPGLMDKVLTTEHMSEVARLILADLERGTVRPSTA